MAIDISEEETEKKLFFWGTKILFFLNRFLADKIYFIEKGKVTGLGKHKTYDKYVDEQFKVDTLQIA